MDLDDIKVCLDLRVVNALTKDPSNILPSSMELFEHIQGVKYFTEIDLMEVLGFLAPDKS